MHNKYLAAQVSERMYIVAGVIAGDRGWCHSGIWVREATRAVERVMGCQLQK